MSKRVAILTLALAILPEPIVSVVASQHISSEDPTLVIKSIDEGPGPLGWPLRKFVGSMSIVNHGREDLCIKADVLANELSPYMVINDTGAEGIPNPPLVEGVTRIGQGKAVSFKRVVAFRELDQPKRRLRVRATVSAWWCDREVFIRLRSNVFRG